MVTNPDIRAEVLKRLGITKQGLSYRAKKMKEAYGPMTTEEAVYVIAHLEGIDLSSYLPISTLDRVRALVPRDLPSAQPQHTSRGAKKSVTPSVKKVKPYPLVSAARVKIGKDLGTRTYPLLFTVENSIRELISMLLSKQGSKWWDNTVPANVKNNVDRTMKKETRYPYRDKRGNHPLSFANFGDLKKIIMANQSAFQDVILDFVWFEAKMDEIYMVRNNIAHCVPLSADDITRINLFFRDWARLLDTAGIK